METRETTDHSVSAIIATFKASLDEFKNYRERRKRLKKSNDTKFKPSHGRKEGSNGSTGEEMKLSRSLKAGVVDVQQEYNKHFQTFGDKYAVGDSTAHSSLGRTLRKLNTCLHNIVASLLLCNSQESRLDYNYLTSVSDVSRQEALEALSLLSFRMSQSAFSTHQARRDERSRRGSQTESKSSSSKKLRNTKSEANLSERSRQQKSKDKREPEVRKVQLKSTSTPKLALVRPAATRRSSSSKSASSATIPSPPPAYSPTSPGGLVHPTPVDARLRRPVATNQNVLARSTSMPIPHVDAVQQAYGPPPVQRQPTLPNKLSPGVQNRRRENAHTASIYTFASASTRLGEIPEPLWATPYDYDEMVRLNRVHGGKPWPPPADVVAKPKRGFLGLFKKGAMKAEGIGVTVAT